MSLHAILYILLLMAPLLSCGSEDKRDILYLCLHNCAICVKQWEPGLYNGPRCARRCLRNRGLKIVDPDCNKVNLFNHNAKVLKKYLKRLHHNPEDIESIT